MIELQKIKKMTELVAKAIKIKLEKEEKERQRRESVGDKHFKIFCKNLSRYEAAIEEAAKNGLKRCVVKVGDEQLEIVKLHIKNIKHSLKEFNPIFRETKDCRIINMDNPRSDKEFTRIDVEFSW